MSACRGLVGTAWALAACATPYQRMGVRGGYSDQRLDNGDILITVKVNGNTDAAVALAYMHRRAGELCPGGYETKDGSQADDSSWTRTTGTIHRAELNRVIRCKGEDEEAASTAPPADPNARKIAHGDTPLFCALAQPEADVGTCWTTQEQCSAAIADTSLSCVPRAAGACFNTLHIIDNMRGVVCAPSIGACETARAKVEADPDFKQDRQCGIYRGALSANE